MFSLRVKELRQTHNLSQKELARILNVSTGTVGNWEAGTREPNFAMTRRIAALFRVSLDFLIGEEHGSFLTPLEAEMMNAFRSVGRQFGENGQRAVLSVMTLLSEGEREEPRSALSRTF